MSKLGQRLLRGAREGRAIVRGEADPATYRVHVPPEVDVRKIRNAFKLSQEAFAARFGLPAATVRDWEQNRRKPEGAARVLLQVIKREPEAVRRALRPTSESTEGRAIHGSEMVRRRRQAQGRSGAARRQGPLHRRRAAAGNASCRLRAQHLSARENPRVDTDGGKIARRACISCSPSRTCRSRCAATRCRCSCRIPPSPSSTCPMRSPAPRLSMSASRSPSWWPTAAISPRTRPHMVEVDYEPLAGGGGLRRRASSPAVRSPTRARNPTSRRACRSRSATPMPPSRPPPMWCASASSSIAAGRSSWSAAASSRATTR